ncbi:MAG TPA: nucleotide exchange factor GrpE [Anaerolineae bacterium]|nr:nucleotide exchange factor GrpE [Anaerolineae bacterium]
MSSKTAKKQKEKDVIVNENTEETTPNGDEETTAESPSVEELQAELEAARAEAAKNLDGWQRATAELQNFKRRQMEQASRREDELTAKIIAQLFPVLDDLDLAFQNIPDTLTEQEANWVEGFKLVQRKLLKILEDYNVESIATDGEFDPNLHEAVTHEESAEHDSNAIIAELRKGYKRGDRVLRPSLVRVAQ